MARRATAYRTGSPTATPTSSTASRSRPTTVLTETRQLHDGENKADQTIDLTPYLGPDKAAYVRVSDSFPTDGWGGRVYHVSAAYS